MAKNGNVNANKVGFFKGLKLEFKRMTWPTKEEVKKSTLAVITFCLIFAAITTVLDKGFKTVFDAVFFR